MSCEICDQNEYHQNDWHCSHGLIGPKIKEWFDIDSDDEEEDPIKCDKCNTNTYRSHQEYPDTWQYNYMAFCKDCLKEMNEYSDDEEVKPKKKLIIKKKKKLIIKKKKKLIIKPKKKEEILSWEDLIGYPTGIYNSYKEMIYSEYGEHSEQALDLDKSFRNAVELNKK